MTDFDASILQYEIHDSLTDRKYYNFNEEEWLNGQLVELVDKNNFRLATYEDTSRVLLKDGTLVIIKTSPNNVFSKIFPEATQTLGDNSISFYLNKGTHAQIEFNYPSKGIHKFYDLESKVRESDTFLSREDIPFKGIAEIGSPLKFYLSDEQADEIYANINELHSNKKYTWVPVVQNCVRFLSDIYPSFSAYHLDEDLLNNIGGDTGRPAFVQRYMEKVNYQDANKSKVVKFISKMYGGQFDWKKIKFDKVDLDEANKDSLIADRISDYNDSKLASCKPFIDLFAVQLTEQKLEKTIEQCINRPVTYENLLFPATPVFELEILKHFEQETYKYKVIAPFGYDINKACSNFESFKDDLQDLCKTWCEVNTAYAHETVCENWNSLPLNSLCDAHDEP